MGRGAEKRGAMTQVLGIRCWGRVGRRPQESALGAQLEDSYALWAREDGDGGSENPTEFIPFVLARACPPAHNSSCVE